MTAFTQTHIANLSLGHLGEYRIDDIDTDNETPAQKVRDFWDIARLEALGAYEWGFATDIKALTRNDDAPDAGYQYKYDQPALWLRTIRVTPTSTFSEDGVFTQWAFRDGYFETDEENLYVEYIYDHTTVGTWPPWFVTYMGYVLAKHIVPGILGPSFLKDFAEMADRNLLSAKARDAQQQPVKTPKPSKWQRALRGQRTWA